MNEHQTQSIARQQISERVAEASVRRLANHLPGARRHRLGLGLRRRGDTLDDASS